MTRDLKEYSMPKTTRQWIYGKPVENDKLGPEQFELREIPLPELMVGEAQIDSYAASLLLGQAVRILTS